MNQNHEMFEIRCSLAVSGGLSEGEFAELNEHLNDCGECRQRLDEALWVDCQLVMAGGRGVGRLRAPRGMMERFLARAANEGIPVRQRRQAAIPCVALGALAVAILCLAPFAIGVRGRDVLRRDAQADTVAAASAVEGWNFLTAAAVLRGADRRFTKSHSVHRRIGHRSAIRAGASLDFQFPLLDEIAAWLRRDAFSPSTADPRPALVFVSAEAASSCDGDRAVLSLPDLKTVVAPGPRVFCYNPRIASLTSLDLFHAAASNGPRVFSDTSGFTWRRGGP